jgi:dTMP kinase
MYGKFIVIEGPDGCGKTKLWDGLKDRISSDKVLFVRDPGTTAISLEIRKILLNSDFTEMEPTTELLLYMAARDQLVHQSILPALKKGINVISDRYIQSTLAYQCDGNATKGESVSRELVIGLAKRMKHPVPDALINLSKGATVPLLRERLAGTGKCADRLEQNNDEYFEAVLMAYQLLERATASQYHKKCFEIDIRNNEQAVLDAVISLGLRQRWFSLKAFNGKFAF